MCVVVDSACQKINLKHNCYVFDPSCPPPNPTEKTDDNLVISITIGGIVAVVIIALLFVLFYHQRKKRNQSKGTQETQSLQSEIILF